jgi:hypothetical protein
MWRAGFTTRCPSGGFEEGATQVVIALGFFAGCSEAGAAHRKTQSDALSASEQTVTPAGVFYGGTSPLHCVLPADAPAGDRISVGSAKQGRAGTSVPVEGCDLCSADEDQTGGC